MGNDFNGTYIIESDVTYTLSEAHSEALELLGVVHKICCKNNLKYTLIGKALLCHIYKKNFSEINPEISILISYNEFIILKDKLKETVKNNSDKYVLADFSNTDQFDSIAFWFAKKNRVKLPKEREKEELYYFTHIKVFPAFFAGHTNSDFKKIKKKYCYAENSLKARAAFPQRTIVTKIKLTKKIIKDKYYRSKRQEVNLATLLCELGSLYTLDNSVAFFTPIILNKKIYLNELSQVKENEFCGQKCMISLFAEDLINKTYSPKQKECILKFRISDLASKGGEMLRRVQKVQTEMLIEFDRVCRKNNICYHIAFGTLLGAVRHKGFIPWDDDIDVILPYNEYIKLDEAMKKDLDTERFFWRTIDTDKDFNLTFKHLKRNGTIYTKPGRDKFDFHRGVLIDVFPIFPSANNIFSHWIQTKLCVFWRRIVWAYMGIDSEKNILKKLFYKKMNLRGVRNNHNSFLKCALMYRKKNKFYSYYNANFRSPYHTYYLSDEAFENTVEYEFEGHKFLGPQNYDSALSYCFSKDYMLLPKPDSRTPSHFAIIELGDLFSFK